MAFTKIAAAGIDTSGNVVVQNLNSTGIVTAASIVATTGTFSGNVSIAGTLTYEDVTNVDSIGLVTARNGVRINTGGLVVTSGVSTLGNTVVGGATTQLVVTGDARITGILTIGTSSVTLDGTNNQVNVGTGVTLHHTNGVQVGSNTLHSSGLTLNTLNVGTGGTIITTTSAGLVGVGTTLPITSLTISGSSLASGELGRLAVTGNTSAKRLAIGVDSVSTMYSWMQSVESGINFRNLILQPLGGNLGIGTANPTDKLEVNGDFKVILDNVQSPTKNVARIVSLGQYGVTGARNWALRGAYQYSSGINVNADGGDLDLIKSINQNTVLATKTDGTGLGSVGIGTINPIGVLAVSGGVSNPTITFQNGSATNTASDAAIGSVVGYSRTTGGHTNVGSIDIRTDTTNATSGVIRFLTASTGSLTERVRIDSSGRLCIGINASPNQKLTLTDGNLSLYTTTYSAGEVTNKTITSYAKNGSSSNLYDADAEISFGKVNGFDVDWTHGSFLAFKTTDNNRDTAPVERFRIDQNGNIEAKGSDGGFVAPARRTISSVIRYGTGFSYRDPSNNIRPVIHVKVASYGAAGAGNLGGSNVWLNGVNIGGTGRSWGLYVISGGGSNIGQLLVANTYDIYGNGGAQTTMINDIASYFTNDNILIINTHDEPEQNAATLRATLRDTYGAKQATMTTAFRYAYCYAFRYGYGALAEQHSATWESSGVYTSQGNNSKAVAGISFSVVL